LEPEPRPEIASLRAAEHGGGAPSGVVDFSTGISPLPAPREILDAARGADLARYPHPTALPLRLAVADLHRTSPDRIVAGAGSVELIWALARAFGGPGRTGLVVTPAFAEYQQALRASGADVVTVAMTPPRFELSVEDLQRALAVAGQRAGLVFVCRPSNPCLSVVPADELAAIARRWPRTLFVVDEAYQPMFEDVPETLPAANVVLLRSMTKVFALPGLRLGYLLASPATATAVQMALPPWNVASAAQAAGIVAARLLPSCGAAIRARITMLRRSLEHALLEIAGRPERAAGPFLLWRAPSADELARRLLEGGGVMVRSCASFGLPEHIRIGVRGDDDNAALVAAWRAAKPR
jgi:histidinol-phosphate/aromatic aminotransferase/cobyric acid decarboxylase-like protein